MTTQDRVYHNVSKQLGVPIKIIEPIFVSQFKLVVEAMGRGNSEAVSLPKFGTFSVRPKAKENLENSIKSRKNGQHSSIEEEI